MLLFVCSDNLIFTNEADEGGETRKPSTVSLLVVVIVLLFIALSSSMVYFVCIRPRQASLSQELTRLASVDNLILHDSHEPDCTQVRNPMSNFMLLF